VPGTLTTGNASVEVNPLGPAQETVTSVREPKGITSEALGLEQVNGPVLPGVKTGGAVLFEVTVTLALPVFEELVPVTVYVPTVLTVILAPVAVKPLGPVQLYVVVPEAVVLAVMVVDRWLQVSTPELLADAVTVICVVGASSYSPDRANSGFPGRDENKIKERMAKLCLFRSNDTFIYGGLVYG